MLRIGKCREGKKTVLAVSGHIEDENLDQLEALCGIEPQKLVFDLRELSLAGRGAVSFLARWEARGVTLRDCPAYIREWIDQERRGEA